jgi:hypothetical protein
MNFNKRYLDYNCFLMGAGSLEASAHLQSFRLLLIKMKRSKCGWNKKGNTFTFI